MSANVASVIVTFTTVNERTGRNWSAYHFKTLSAAETFAETCLEDKKVVSALVEKI